MGLVKHLSSDRAVVLGAHSVAGRSLSCAVGLVDTAASNDHASIFWTGVHWEARDLGSTNGTFVGDHRLKPRENVPLSRGTVLRFGCDGERWELVDDRGPVVLARAVGSDEVRAAEEGLLALPGPDEVLVSIVEASPGQWIVEISDEARRPAVNGERLTVAGQEWELSVPPRSPVLATERRERPQLTLARVTLRFNVSRDEEHVVLAVVNGEQVISLGERASFYFLLLLARERSKEAAEGKIPPEEQGWVHVLDFTQSLNIDERALNVAVFRVRQALAAAGVEGAEGVVERRLRQIRIGIERLEEVKA